MIIKYSFSRKQSVIFRYLYNSPNVDLPGFAIKLW